MLLAFRVQKTVAVTAFWLLSGSYWGHSYESPELAGGGAGANQIVVSQRGQWNRAAAASLITQFQSSSGFAQASVDRTARVSIAELEVPNAPRRARVSFAETEVPTAPRRARISLAELEAPDAPTVVFGSEFLQPSRRISDTYYSRAALIGQLWQSSFAVPRRAQVSFAELEVPTAPRKAQVSFAELEVPSLGGALLGSDYQPRPWKRTWFGVSVGVPGGGEPAPPPPAPNASDWQPLVGWDNPFNAALGGFFLYHNGPTLHEQALWGSAWIQPSRAIADTYYSRAARQHLLWQPGFTTPRRAQVSFGEFEVPSAPRRARVSLAEVEVPNASRRARISLAELEAPNAPRRARLSFSELEVPNTNKARLSFCEFEIPSGPRRVRISFGEFEVLSPGEIIDDHAHIHRHDVSFHHIP